MFLYLNVLLQRNQTGKSGWAGFRVPERYDCRTKDHVSFEKIWFKVDGPSKVKVLHMTSHFQIGHLFSKDRPFCHIDHFHPVYAINST